MAQFVSLHRPTEPIFVSKLPPHRDHEMDLPRFIALGNPTI